MNIITNNKTKENIFNKFTYEKLRIKQNFRKFKLFENNDDIEVFKLLPPNDIKGCFNEKGGVWFCRF